MSAIYKEPLSVLKRLLFIAMVVLGMTVGIGGVDAAGIVSGKVYNDTNNDGSYSLLSDFAVSGVTVELQPYNGGAAIKTTTTNTNGEFEFTGVTTPNNYRVIVKANTSYSPVTFDDFSLSLNQDKTGTILLVKGLGGSISGSIFMDANRNGVLDSGENTGYAASDNMKVHLRLGSTNTSPIISSVYMSKTDGSYSFKNLPSGVAYTVTLDAGDVDMKGYAAVTSSDSASISKPISYIKITSVTSGITSKNIGITEVNGDGVGGFVVVDQNGDNAYVIGEDAPLNGATVTLYYDDETTLVPNVLPGTSNATGAYQIKNIPLWKYKVKVTPPAGNIPTGVSPPSEVVSGKPIFLALDMSKVEPHSSRNFYMKGDPADPTKTGISGFVFGYDSVVWSDQPGPDGGGTTVNDPAGTKFSNITVKLYNNIGTLLYTQQTKSDGSYGFSGLAAGIYKVTINKADTDLKYNTYVFMNDADGKSDAPVTPHPLVSGGKRAGFEITLKADAGVPKGNQNFWFGRADLGRIGIRPYLNYISGNHFWNTSINGFTTTGGFVTADFRLYQEDGRRALTVGGAEVADLAITGKGMANGSGTFNGGGAIVPGIYKIIPITDTYESSIIYQNAATFYRTGSINGEVLHAPIFKGTNNISGRFYVDVNENGSYEAGTDTPIYMGSARIHRLKADNTVDYSISLMGTSTNGTYSFTNLPDGKYRVLLDDKSRILGNYGDQIIWKDDPTDTLVPQTAIFTVSGQTITNGDLIFLSKNENFSIIGKAYLDIYSSGSLNLNPADPYGHKDIPLGKVKIELFKENGITPVKDSSNQPVFVETDIAGNFKITGDFLSAGKYVIKASKENMTVANIANLAPGATRSIELKNKTDIAIGEIFLLQGPGYVSGYISYGLNGNGLDSESYNYSRAVKLEKEISAGTWALVHWLNYTVPWNFSNLESGNYRIINNDGLYSVIADRDPNSPLGIINFTVSSSDTSKQKYYNQNMIYAVDSKATIRGRILLDSNDNGIIDDDDMELTTTDIGAINFDFYRTALFLKDFNSLTSSSTIPVIGTAALNGSEYKRPTLSFGNYLVHIDEVALAAKGLEVVTNAKGGIPNTSVLTVPTAHSYIGTVGTLQVPVNTVDKANQDFLVKRITPSEISGRVFNDQDYSNSDSGTDDVGLGEMSVILKQAGKPDKVQRVDANGYYKFSGLLDGTYTLVLSGTPNDGAMSLAPTSPTQYANLKIGTGSGANLTQLHKDFWYHKAGEAGIAGTLMIDVNNNHQPDPQIDYPLAGVKIVLKKGANEVKSVVTNGSGAFKITGIPEDTYTVEVTPANSADSQRLPLGYTIYHNANGATSSNTMTIVMNAGMNSGKWFLAAGDSNTNRGEAIGGPASVKSGISGYLYEGSNATPTANLLAGAVVDLYNGPTLMSSYTTTATGKYQFFNLSSTGNYKIVLRSAPSGYGIRGDVDTITPAGTIATTVSSAVANPGAHNKNIWFATLSETGIKGTVVYQGSAAGSIPLSGLTVELYDLNYPPNVPTNTPIRTSTTDGTGNYKFENIPTVGYVVKVKAQEKTDKGYTDITPVTPGEVTIPALPSGGAPNTHFVLGGAYSFSGKIGIDTNQDNTIETPIDGIETTLLWAGPNGTFEDQDDVSFSSTGATHTVATGKTDLSGNYSYSNLPAGKYRISYVTTNPKFDGLALVPTTTITGNKPSPRDVAITTASATNENFVYEALGGLSGRILFDQNDNGYDATDVGLDNLKVNLYKWNGTAYDATPAKTTTTATVGGVVGFYEFNGIPAATKYKVAIDSTTPMTNYVGKYYVDSAGVSQGATAGTIERTLTTVAANEKNWHIGFVGNVAGGKAGDMTLKTRIDSNSDGLFTFDPANPTNPSDSTKSDSALKNIKVKVTSATGVIPAFSSEITTDASGNGLLKKFPYGTYSFEVMTKPTNPPYTIAYTSAGGSVEPFNMALTATNTAGTAGNNHPYIGYKYTLPTGTAKLSGRIVYDKTVDGVTTDDIKVPGASLVLLKEEGGTYVSTGKAPTFYNADGAYEFTQLPAGNYKIAISGVHGAYLANLNVAKVGSLYETSAHRAVAAAGNETNYHGSFKMDTTKARDVDVFVRFDNNDNKKYDADLNVDTKADGFTITMTKGAYTYTGVSGAITGGTATLYGVPFEAGYTVTIAPGTNYQVVYNGTVTTNGASGSATFTFATAAGSEKPVFGLTSTIVPSGTHRISGHVVMDTDANNVGSYGTNDTPITGVTLKISRKRADGGYEPLNVTISPTNTLGEFSVANLTNTDDYRIDVITAGHAVLPNTDFVFSKGNQVNFTIGKAPATDWNFGYKPKSSVPTGSFKIYTNEDLGTPASSTGDSPLANRVVTVKFSGVTTKYTSTSSGEVSLINMAQGSYTISALDADNAAAPGPYIRTYTENGDISLTGTPPTLANAPKIGFTKNTTGTSKITGKVIVDENNNGSLDAGESGIQGLVLQLQVESATPGTYNDINGATATTGADGTYTFDNRAIDNYRVVIKDSASQTKLANFAHKFGLATKFESSAPITITATNQTITHHMGYIGNTVGGKARNVTIQSRYDSNLNGQYDSSNIVDYPLNGVKMTLTSATLGITLTGTTATNGTAILTNVPFASDYVVVATPIGNTTVVYNSQDGANLTMNGFEIAALVTTGSQEAQDKANIPFYGFKETTPPAGSVVISGEVVLDTNGSNSLDDTDLRIKDVKVVLTYKDALADGAYKPYKEVTTGADGKYSLTGLASGKFYRIEIKEGITLNKTNYNAVFNKGGATGSWVYAPTTAVSTNDATWHYGFKSKTATDMTSLVINTYIDNLPHGNDPTAVGSTDAKQGPFTIIVNGTTADGLVVTGKAFVTGTSGATTGVATATDFAKGTYTFTAQPAAGYAISYPASGTIANKLVDGNQGIQNFSYKVNASGAETLTGYAYFDANNNGAYQTPEGITTLAVKLLKKVGAGSATTDYSEVASGVTDSTGKYTFAGIAGGTYRIEVENSPTNVAKISGYDPAEHVLAAPNNRYSTDVVVPTAPAGTNFNMGYKGSSSPTIARDLIVLTRNDNNGNQKYDASTITDTHANGVTVNVSSMKLGITLAAQTTASGQAVFSKLVYSDDYVIVVAKTDLTAVYDNDHNTGTGGSTGTLTYDHKATGTNPKGDNPFFGFKRTTLPTGGATLSGKISQNNGAHSTGIGGVTVAISYLNGSDLEFLQNVTTDSTGKYLLGSLASGTYEVTVISGIPSGYSIQSNKASAASQTYQGALPAGGADDWNFIYGKGTSSNTKTFTIYTWNAKPGTTETAYEAADTALAGIKIRIQGTTKDGNSVNTLYTSNGSGQIILTDFPMSDGTGYTISSSATDNGNHTFKYSSGTGSTESVVQVVSASLPSGNTPYFGYVVKPISGSQKISGTVLYELGATGTTPLVGTTVYLDVQNASTPSQYDNQTSTTVEADGTYKFEGLGNANYQIRIESSDPQIPAGTLISYTKVDNTAVATGWKALVALSGSNRTSDFGFKGAVDPNKFKSISLATFYDTMKNSNYDSTGDTVQKDIILTVTGTKLMTAGQDFDLGATGTYTMANLPLDTYTITSKNHGSKSLKVVYHKGANGSGVDTYSVTTTSTYDSAKPEFFGYFAELTGSATISGRIVVDSDGNGTYTEPTATSSDDLGVNGVQVELYLVPGGSATDQLIDTQTTATVANKVGFYQFGGLDLTKTYRVEVKNTVAPLDKYDPVFVKLNGTGANQIQELLTGNVDNWHIGYKGKAGQNGTLKLQSRWDNGNTTYDSAVATDTVRPNVTLVVNGGVLNNQSVSTGATGETEIKNLAVGSYTLSHNLDSNITVVYNDTTGSNTATSFSRTVTNNATTTVPYGFKMDVYGSGSETIKGRVVVDSNSTLGVQTDDLGLNNIELKLLVKNGSTWQEVTGIPSAKLKTNPTGGYEIDTLIAGEYKLEVVTTLSDYTISTVGPTNAAAGGNPFYSGTVNGGTTGNEWNFGYKGTTAGSLKINARLDENGDGTIANTSGNDPMQKGIKITLKSGTLIDTSFISDGNTKIYYNMPYGSYVIGADLGATVTGQKMQVSYDPNNQPGTANPVTFVSTSGAGGDVAEYGFVGKVDTATGVTVSGRTVIETEPLATATYAGTEEGLLNAKVSIYAEDTATTGGWLLMRTTQVTSGTGNYHFDNLPSGLNYKVEVQRAGMTLKYTKHGTTASLVKSPTAVNTLTKIVNATTDGADWVFAYGGDFAVKGLVSFDTDRTKIYKAGLDLLMDQVEVRITGTMGGVPYTAVTTTNAAGEYKFEGLTAGTWTVSIDPASAFGAFYVGSHYDASYADTNTTIAPGAVASYTVVTSAGMSTNNRNFGFYGDGIVRGQSIIDLNGNGTYETHEANFPLAGMASYFKVTSLSNPAFVPYYVKIKPDGSYELKYLVPGFDYKFEVHTGVPPGTAQPFGISENYSVLKYFASGDITGGGVITTKAFIGTNGVGRTLPPANHPQFIMATSFIAFSTNYNISGRVAYDVNGNGVHDSGTDSGINGVTVQAYSASTGTTETIVTSGNGDYSFTGLAGTLAGDGIWKISIVSPLPTGLVATYESSETPMNLDGVQTITLTEDITNIHFGYRGNNTVEGYIKSDDDNSGTDTSLDGGLLGVTVVLKDSAGHPIATTTTDSTGKYSFTNLSKWNTGVDYEVFIDYGQATLSGYDWLVGGTVVTGKTYRQSITLVDNGTNTVPVVEAFMAKSSNEIRGKVFLDANNNKTYDAGEVGIGTTVKLYRVSDGVLLQTKPISVADGTYLFDPVAKAQYRIEVDPVPATIYLESFDPDGIPTPHIATVTVNSAMSNVNFGYLNSGRITVHVTEATGGTYNAADPGIAGAEILLKDAIGATLVRTGITDGNGFYTFANLDATVDYTVVTQFGITTAGPGKVLAQSEWIDGGSLITGLSDDGEASILAPVATAPHNVLPAVTHFAFKTNNNPVTISKVALKDTAHIGEFVPYTVKIRNNSSTDPVLNMSLSDMIPAGFKYVKGSSRLTVNGITTKIEPVGTRPIEFKGIDLTASGEAKITYILVVGAGVTPGDYVNKAQGHNAAGFTNSNISSATVKVTGDPLFDDSLIFGKVFWDKNRDGRQDKDEPGVGGVKLITARGEIITTDESGRYHLADVSGGRWERGTNFILKLDVRSLPQGLTTTTENPIVVRLSPGLPSRINFGVEVPPPVAARLSEQLALAKAEEVKKIEEKLLKEEKFVVESIHFAFDKDQIESEFENTLDSLAEVLRLYPEWKIRIEGHTDSLGTEAYNKDLSQRRANAVKAYLLKTGVNSTQLVDAVGLGLSEPVADNGTPEGRYKNRRVEFKLEK